MAIDQQTIERWQADPVALAEDCVIRRPDGSLGPPLLTSKQKAVLRALADPTKRTVGVIWPKRSGKTMLASIALIHASLQPDVLSICLSNSEWQATALAFTRVVEILERSPALGSEAVVKGGQISFPWGATIQVVPCNARTVTGIGVTGLLHSDELWASQDESVYHLLASQSEQGKVLLTSQPSGRQSHVYHLWEVYDSGEADPSLLVDYLRFGSLEEAAQGYPNPFISEAFLRARAGELPDAIFRSHFLGHWGAGGSLFRPEVVEVVFDPELKPVAGGKEFNYALGLDLGLRNDRCASVVSHWDEETATLIIDRIRIWEGKDYLTGEVSIGDVEADLLACDESFQLATAVFDPWQLKSTRQRLEDVLPIEEFTFSSTSVARLSQQLFSLVNEGRLRCYPHEQFREELLGLVAVPKSYGWRIDHQASGYSDITMATGMAGLYAPELETPQPFSFAFNGDSAMIFNPDGTIQQEPDAGDGMLTIQDVQAAMFHSCREARQRPTTTIIEEGLLGEEEADQEAS